MVKPENEATPLEAVTVVLPERETPVGLLARAMVTLPLKVVSTCPWAFSAATVTENGAFTATLAGGGLVMTSWSAT